MPKTIRAQMSELTITMMALLVNSCFVGQETFSTSSLYASCRYNFIRFMSLYNQAREERLERPTHGFGDRCSTN